MKYLLLLLAFPLLANTNYKDLMQHRGEIVSIENTKYIALTFKNKDHWHTYWKNPGDAGTPFKHKFTLNGQEQQLEAKEWPIPKRFIESGDLHANGYDGEYTFFFKLPKDSPQQGWEYESVWLICKNICIPEKGSGKISPHPRLKKPLLQRFQNLPAKKSFLPSELVMQLYYDKEENKLHLLSKYKNSKPFDSKAQLVFFENSDYFSFGHEKLYYSKDKKWVVAHRLLDWDGIYMEPKAIPLGKNGLLTKVPVRYLLKESSDIAYVGEETWSHISSFSVFQSELKQLIAINQISKPPKMKERRGYALTLLFAFLGGLILNFMPCVLPVITLKLFNVLSLSDKDKGHIVRHNLAYSAGILSSFSVLALATIILQKAGAQVGWGMHMQSPTFVGIITLLIFYLTLNLLGLYELKTPGGKFFGSMNLRNSFIGDFFSGILTTILSTPCSAPFLGTAITFAFTSPPIVSFFTFNFVGVGLAFPFLLSAIFPQTIQWLPNPGHWMNTLKKFLGLTLLLTCLWLFYIFMGLADQMEQVKLLFVCICLFFSTYIYQDKTIQKWPKILLICGSTIFTLHFLTNIKSLSTDNQSVSKKSVHLDWDKWSPQKLQDYKNKKEAVFMDFTADWCFTCKVNEEVIFSKQEFQDLIKEFNIKLVLADWTNRNETISSWLNKNDTFGVPAYFLQLPSGEIIKLRNVPTIGYLRDIFSKNLK